MKLRKITASLCMAFIFLFEGMTAQAVEIIQVPADDVEYVYNQRVDSNALEGWAIGPQIYSEAGIVMDMDSGAILYAKNIDNPHYPASITKLLTALVALENSELTDMVTVKREDIEFLEPGDSHIGLKVGEEITMEDALHAVLLASANEASHAVASSREGGHAYFLQLMNDKVKELGGTNSNFTNTHGLHDENHYTTARDMALIGAAVFQNADFRRMTTTLQYTITETNITNETRTFQQNHKMLYKWRSQYYEYCVGGKTGFTDQARNTLVTFATKGETNLVAVVLRARGNENAYKDTAAMLDYAFDNFSKVPVTLDMVEAKGLEAVEKNAYLMLPEGITVEQLEYTVENPQDLGDKTGEVVYTYQGQIVGKADTTITDDFYNKLHGIKEMKEVPKEEKEGRLLWIKIFFGVVIGIAVLFLLFLCFVTYRRWQIRKRRAARRKRKRELEMQRNS